MIEVDDEFAKRYFLAREWYEKRHCRTQADPKTRYNEKFKSFYGMTLDDYAVLAKRENHQDRIAHWKRQKAREKAERESKTS